MERSTTEAVSFRRVVGVVRVSEEMLGEEGGEASGGGLRTGFINCIVVRSVRREFSLQKGLKLQMWS